MPSATHPATPTKRSSTPAAALETLEATEPADSYGFLDRQFARLLVRLCADAGHPLTDSLRSEVELLASHTSHATRQGIIAVPLPPALQACAQASWFDLPVIGQPGDYKPLILEDGHVWLNRYFQYEQRLADNISTRLHTLDLSASTQAEITATLDEWLPDKDTHLQKKAIQQAANTPFLIISGGPGTGKTTTVMRLLCLLVGHLQVNPQRILLAAPTGKAAMRLQESIRTAKNSLNLSTELRDRIPEQGSTLHRLLGFIPGKVGFRHHAHHPLPADVVIVDEASMIDVSLMTHLFEAVSPRARLILLGDKDQLASVETGSIFRDLCAKNQNESMPHPLDAQTVVLEKSWRFSADSGIGQLAKAVRDRDEPTLLALLEDTPAGISWAEAARIERSYLQTVWQDYLQAVCHWQQQTTDLEPLFTAFNRFRILTPLRKGALGTEQLNQNISKLLAPSLGYTGSSPWYAGRPVMVTQNDYRQGLFNGDIGITLPAANGQLRVWFADNAGSGFRAFASVRLPAHETAWALTIHKSQGSEFDQVLLMLPENEDAQILGRELLYTGITRARSGIDIMGKLAVLQAALRHSLPASSRIRQRLLPTL